MTRIARARTPVAVLEISRVVGAAAAMRIRWPTLGKTREFVRTYGSEAPEWTRDYSQTHDREDENGFVPTPHGVGDDSSNNRCNVHPKGVKLFI
jgi:hypothetical protein